MRAMPFTLSSLLLGLLLLLSGRVLSAPAATSTSDTPAPARAASVFDLSLDDLASLDVEVGSTGFFNTLRSKAPNTVTVISREQIETSPATNLAQLLEFHVPGVHVGYNQRLGPLIGVRGIMPGANSKIMTMLDGENLNQRMQFGYMAGYTSPFLGDLQAVEVARGPSAIAHGSGAINGYVNLVPKNGADNPGSFFRADYGPTTQLGLLEAGHGWSYGAGGDPHDKNVYVYGGLAYADGMRVGDTYDFAESAKPKYPGWQQTQVQGFPRLSSRLAAYWRDERWKTNVAFQDLNPDTNGLEDIQFFHQSILSVRPQYTLPVNRDSTLESSLSAEWTDYSLNNDMRALGTANSHLYREVGGSESHLEGQLLYRTRQFAHHELAIGALDDTRDFRAGKNYFSGNPDAGTEGETTSWREWALFTEDVWQPKTDTTISLGGRYDHVGYRDIDTSQDLDFSSVGTIHLDGKAVSHFSPRVAVARDVSPDTVVKLSFQEGFLTPDVNFITKHAWVEHIVQSSGYPDFSLPMLKPETMQSVELGVHHSVTAKTFSWDANLFYNTYHDMIHYHSFVPGEGYMPDTVLAAVIHKYGWLGGVVNADGDFSAAGVGISGNWNPEPDASLTLSYSYSRPVDTSAAINHSLLLASDNRNAWGKFPPHMVKLDATRFYLHRRLLFSLNVIYESDPQTATIATPAAPVPNVFASPRYQVNLATTYAINPRLSFKLSVVNLFQEDTPPVGFQPAEPFNGYLGSDARVVNGSLQWKW